MSSPNNGLGWRGFQEPSTAGADFNAQSFLVWSILSRIATTTLVEVKAVTNDGGVSPIGFVDVQPQVNQVDGAGNAVPHGIIYRCPYLRVQGGANAVILDPQVGDVGIMVFASSDISSVTANKGRANPGSRRRFDMADGLYLGMAMGGAPTQYVRFSSGGIEIHSPSTVTIVAPNVQITGDVAITGALHNNGTNVGSTHKHGGVSPGGSDTGGPH